MGAALLLMSCGGSGGQIGDAGNGGGGRAGSGAAGGVGGQTGGTGGGGASCATVSACGGDLVGTWKVTQSCLTSIPDLSGVCAGASGELAYMFSGTVTYNVDGTYSSMFDATVAGHERYPSGCAPHGLTCAELEQSGRQAVDAGKVISYTCSTDAAGACNCDSVTPESSANTSGTYSISGGTLTTTADGMTSTSSYCVQGGILGETPRPAADAGLAAMGNIVLSKQ
jgi:hypothetical protein